MQFTPLLFFVGMLIACPIVLVAGRLSGIGLGPTLALTGIVCWVLALIGAFLNVPRWKELCLRGRTGTAILVALSAAPFVVGAAAFLITL